MFDQLFSGSYLGRRVLVTGHTGFKGSWLCEWLQLLDAEVTGFALPPETEPNHYACLDIPYTSHFGNILCRDSLAKIFSDCEPEIVFHLAAQPLVRDSYANPILTFETNIIGTVNVLEAARRCPATRALINVTTDKCYENEEREQAYSENDRLGGHDPYSASKACAELVTQSYRRSFQDAPLMATARAGNVIGGGDWARDRLIPDVARAQMDGATTAIRHPNATRPWQHVLEPLAGYLLLGQKLLSDQQEAASAWNFGPDLNAALRVGDVLERMQSHWPFSYEVHADPNSPHEAGLLNLDCSKAKQVLNWRPLLSVDEMLKMTASWYQQFAQDKSIITHEQIYAFVALARERQAVWA